MGCGVVTQLAKQFVQQGVNALEDVSSDHKGAGVSVKVVNIPKREFVLKHKHDYSHLSVLISGAVIVKTDASEVTLDASHGPVSIVIEGGQWHGLMALEDSVWLCVHVDGVN